jgi:Leucine-rich repeat (LRR) protein
MDGLIFSGEAATASSSTSGPKHQESAVPLITIDSAGGVLPFPLSVPPQSPAARRTLGTAAMNSNNSNNSSSSSSKGGGGRSGSGDRSGGRDGSSPNGDDNINRTRRARRRPFPRGSLEGDGPADDDDDDKSHDDKSHDDESDPCERRIGGGGDGVRKGGDVDYFDDNNHGAAAGRGPVDDRGRGTVSNSNHADAGADAAAAAAAEANGPPQQQQPDEVDGREVEAMQSVPGAFRMGGRSRRRSRTTSTTTTRAFGEDEEEGEIDEDDDMDDDGDILAAAGPQVFPPPLPLSRVTTRTSTAQFSSTAALVSPWLEIDDGTILLEADLVVEPDAYPEAAETTTRPAMLVTAKPIRRKRQVAAVAGLVVLTAVIVGTTTGVILTRPDPPRAPSYRLVNVSSLQAEFNRSVRNTTLDAISRGSTPPSDAYHWLFGPGHHPDVPQADSLPRLLHRFALATLFYATGGNDSSWTSATGWLDRGEHECLWHGVECTNGTASELSQCTNEFGIPTVSCQIRDAFRMEALDLSGNGLQRTLPGEFGLLGVASNIARITLDDNALVGDIPSEIDELTTLRVLSIFRNKLGRTISATMGVMSNLESVFLGQNELTGTIPVSLTNLTKLRVLDVSQNHLTGKIPTWVGLMTSLSTIVLARNALSGPVPSQIAQLKQLVILDVSGNSLTVSPLPVGSAMTSLQVLAVSDNAAPTAVDDDAVVWEQAIPTQIGDLASLSRLELNSCGLRWAIPTELGRLEKLEYVLLSDNMLSGDIPTEVGNLRSLVVWNTARNWMTGSLPSELATLPALEQLVVANNVLKGTIPAEFGNMTALAVCDLTSTSLTGRLPVELGRLASLEEFIAPGTCESLASNSGVLCFLLGLLTHPCWPFDSTHQGTCWPGRCRRSSDF